MDRCADRGVSLARYQGSVTMLEAAGGSQGERRSGLSFERFVCSFVVCTEHWI